MLESKIKALKNAIETQSSLTPAKKAELLALSEQLESELKALPAEHDQKAEDIISVTHAAVEAPDKTHHHGLQDHVREFEVSHPNLSRIVQSIFAQFGV